MKVLVEFFDSCQLHNVIAAISLHPERVIFIGDSATMETSRREALQRFFRLRKQKIVIEYITVQSCSYRDIHEKISSVLKKHTDVCFDVTGGRDLFLLALGELSCCQKTPMIRFDVPSGKMIRIKNAEQIPEPTVASLTVRQSIVLNGGEVIDPQNYLSSEQLTPTFSKEVRSLFQISKQRPKLWNQFVIALEGLINQTAVGSDLKVSVKVSSVPEIQYRKLTEYAFLEKLADAGLILDYCYDGERISFRYKNEQVHRCMAKSGNILELYSYLLIHEISKESTSVFGDKRVGVPVDWDGVIEPRYRSGTKNEIDLILTKKTVPVFISCKHGEVLKEALYELHTVAEHYGGMYAKKVLITAELSNIPSKRISFLERARDMGIEVIYNANRMTEEEFKQRLRKIGTP